MASVDRRNLEVALVRFSQTVSVLAPERVCLAASGGRLPAFTGRDGRILHWTGSSLPWFLRPLGLIASAGRCVVELTTPESILAFAGDADDCFTVRFYSFSRALLPAVIEHLRAGGWDCDVAEVADQDPTFAELCFNCEGGSHNSWLVFARHNRDCPSDLAESLDAIED